MNISQLMAQSYHTLLEVMLHRKSEISSQQLQKIKASIFMPCIDKISLNLKKSYTRWCQLLQRQETLLNRSIPSHCKPSSCFRSCSNYPFLLHACIKNKQKPNNKPTFSSYTNTALKLALLPLSGP